MVLAKTEFSQAMAKKGKKGTKDVTDLAICLCIPPERSGANLRSGALDAALRGMGLAHFNFGGICSASIRNLR